MSAQEVANFDLLARGYALLEMFTFGGALARRRTCFLGDPCVADARSVLVLGDGDGRFTAALLERYPTLEVDAVDASEAMLRALQRRVSRQRAGASLKVHHADARAWSPPRREYDVVAAHFFFDCFTSSEVARMIARITPTLAPNARWVVSEFAIPPGKGRALFARVLVRALYFAFKILTGLEVSQLPDYPSILVAAGFACTHAEIGLGGAVRSELWQRSTAHNVEENRPAATSK